MNIHQIAALLTLIVFYRCSCLLCFDGTCCQWHKWTANCTGWSVYKWFLLFYKARFIRRTSAVSNSIQLSAAEMRQVIQTSNFCRIEFFELILPCMSVSGKMLQRLRNFLLIWRTKILNGGFLFYFAKNYWRKAKKEAEYHWVTTEPMAMVKVVVGANDIYHVGNFLPLHFSASSLFFFCGAKFSLSDKE